MEKKTVYVFVGDYLITTRTEDEVKELHEMTGEGFNNISIFQCRIRGYDKYWYWNFDKDGKLQGRSGYGEPANTISQLNLTTIYFNNYKNIQSCYILTEEQMKAVEGLVFVLEHFREYYLATEALTNYNKQFK